jgi:hypothetical protein
MCKNRHQILEPEKLPDDDEPLAAPPMPVTMASFG